MSSQPEGARLVRIKGLPPKASADDVIEFFQEFKLNTDCVHLVVKDRRSAGEALVEFACLEDAQQACSKDRDIFSPKYGDRYVRVLLVEDLSPSDLRNSDATLTSSKATRSNGRRSNGNGEAETVAKVCNLPPGITLQELLQLFWGLQAKPASTHIIGESGARVEAYVDFESTEHAQQAVNTRHGTMVTTAMGVFQLTVQRVSKSEWEGVVASRQRCAGIVRVKGLPTRATADDVLAFFQGFSVKKGGVHVQPQSENRHSKVAFVEFSTPEEAMRALSRDRQQFGEAFGDRYCLLQLATRQEMEQARLNFWRSSSGNGTSSSSGNGSGGGATRPSSSNGGAQGSPNMVGAVLGPLGMLPHAMPVPATAAAAGLAAAALLGMPPVGPAGLLHPGAATAAVAAATVVRPNEAAMPPGPPAAPPLFPVPGIGMGHGMAPGPPRGLMHLGAGLMPPPAAVAAAAAAAAGAGPSAMPVHMQGLAWNGPVAARYMVQDLSTGQRVFLDPRYNVTLHPGDIPPAPAPWMPAPTQQSQSMSMSEHSNGGGQQQQSGPVGLAAAQSGAAALFGGLPPFPLMPGLGPAVGFDGQPGRMPVPSNGGGSGGSSNTANGSGGGGNGSGSGSGSEGRDGQGGDGSDRGSDGEGGGGSSGGSGTDQPPAHYNTAPAVLAAHPHHHGMYHHGGHSQHQQQQHHHQQQQQQQGGLSLPPPLQLESSTAAAHPHHYHHPHHAAHPHRQHPIAHPSVSHAHHNHPHGAHHALKHSASRGSTAVQADGVMEPMQKRCRSQE